ncbi:hypothetical protein [Methylocella sp. CPCC 101449]|uniref:hypothetical protein n=1 Tax=Methylocella sp. CPCC 101449 TaxID=2987531 RepID=UPI002891C806|nr:hypothetical protein [Methylocella sp. CPCC 101449]MDT2024596.1 hypothetical protein [Methylocella sp. CPCC 101449]
MAAITRMYSDYGSALNAVAALEKHGVPQSDISIVASNADDWFGKPDKDRDGTDDRAEGTAAGASIGVGVGGVAGLLTGLGIMAIPGLGPIVAAGWLASTATVAAAGGVAGGLLGALTQGGVSEEDANIYSEGVRRGGSIVTVRTANASNAEIERILDQNSIDTRTRADSWRQEGWQRFDPEGPPMTSDQIKASRTRYLES